MSAGVSTFDVFRKGDNLRAGYAYYCGRCKQEGIAPVSFRVWARADSEYDLEWEIAKYEYEQEAIDLPRRSGGTT